MSRDSTVIPFRQPDAIDDPLTELAREGARRMLAQALIAEADAFVGQWKDLKLPDGRDRVVRHGHGPQRTIQTGVGPVEVRRAKVRDRGEAGAAEKIRFSSSILPKWARRTKSLDALLPVLYLRGVSTGDFQEALAALLGKDAPNLSPAVIARLTAEWQADYDAWRRRDLSARRYVYVWADGVYLQARMEDAAECMLVLIGATPEGKKELVGFQTGVRESAQSWRELLIDIKQRGLEIAPDLAVGDGALGFWKAIEQVFPSTRHQRCWVHKTANVLNKVALSVQANMKTDLREIYGAPTRAAAEAAIDLFADKYGAKYEKTVACLTKDREALLAFFDFPAEHWDHLRTSNPIESVFATVRHRTVRTKGTLSAKTAKLMVFKLVDAAAKTWRRLKGENQLPKVIAGIKFQNGIEVIKMPAHHAALSTSSPNLLHSSCIEASKLCFRALTAARAHKHVDVVCSGPSARVGPIDARRVDAFDNEELGRGGHRFAAVVQDRSGPIIVPVVNDMFEKIDVGAVGHGRKKIATHCVAAIGDVAVAGSREHLWGEQRRIKTGTKRNHSPAKSGRLTSGDNFSRSPLVSHGRLY
jgi:putative transposase